MQSVAVLSRTGRKLMPTNAYRARKLLKSGRAGIECYKPVFTIRLTDRKEGAVQPVEYAYDTGYQHVGVSIKSEKHEFVHAQYDMPSNETERHNDCRKYRRTRRNRKRYRKPRFDNRSKKNKDMAPSLRHRMENQIRLFESFCRVLPITTATFEMGKFDTQLVSDRACGSIWQRSLYVPDLWALHQRWCHSAHPSYRVLDESAVPVGQDQQSAHGL